MTEELFNKTLEENPNATMVITLPPNKHYLGFLFDFPLFCSPLGNGNFEIETDLNIVDGGDRIILRTKFNNVHISFKDEGFHLDVLGNPIWELIGRVEKGRTEEDYNADRKKSKAKDSI